MKSKIEEIHAKIAEIGEQLKDTSLPNWYELSSLRNSLSVELKRLTERVMPKNATSMDSVNLRQFNI